MFPGKCFIFNKYRIKVKLAEERVRMALEEKLNEMWQPAEVLSRIASFVDSEFRNVGNDELTSVLENIRDMSREINNRDTKKEQLTLDFKDYIFSNQSLFCKIPCEVHTVNRSKFYL